MRGGMVVTLLPCTGDLGHYLSEQRSLQQAVDEKVSLLCSTCVS